MSETRTIRVGLPLAGVSVQYLRELRHVVIYEDEDEGKCAVLMPYAHYLQMQALVLRADQLLDEMSDG